MSRELVKEWQFDKALCQIFFIKIDEPTYSRLAAEQERYEKPWLQLEWYCGYAIIPVVLDAEDDSMYDYEYVHGGITWVRPDAETTTLGFDCAHAEDVNNPNCYDLDWLTKETEKLAEWAIGEYCES